MFIGAYKICGHLDEFPTGIEVNDPDSYRGAAESDEEQQAI